MNHRITVNKEVFVPEMYFKNESPEVRGYPRRMEYEGREYTFMEGLRLLIHKGQKLVQVFDMTDGNRDYRLQFDNSERSWTLVDMTI
ncbi:MAG TPA: hypothetical protein VLI54_05100 [Bacillota bacterium]|nr:hypothetical protein [Bacillota bacterium]